MKSAACLLALLLALPVPARAQDFPTRPITLVVPLGAGGVIDVISRAPPAAKGTTMRVIWPRVWPQTCGAHVRPAIAIRNARR